MEKTSGRQAVTPDVTLTWVVHVLMWKVVGEYVFGVSQHAEFIFEVRFAPRRQQMGYPGDTPLSRYCRAV